MAIQRGILRFTGRVGSVVGRKGVDGKYIMSEHQPIVNSPNSDEQKEVQSSLAIASKVAAMLGILGQQVNIANGYAATRRGKLVANLYSQISGMTPPLSGSVLPAELPLVSNPDGVINREATIRFVAPEVDASGSATLTWQNNLDDNRDTLERNLAAILVYNEDKREWLSVAQVLAPSAASIMLYITNEWRSDVLHIYGYVMGVVRGATNVLVPPYSMGSMIGAEEGFIVHNTADILVGNYRYPQISSVYQKVTVGE